MPPRLPSLQFGDCFSTLGWLAHLRGCFHGCWNLGFRLHCDTGAAATAAEAEVAPAAPTSEDLSKLANSCVPLRTNSARVTLLFFKRYPQRLRRRYFCFRLHPTNEEDASPLRVGSSNQSRKRTESRHAHILGTHHPIGQWRFAISGMEKEDEKY